MENPFSLFVEFGSIFPNFLMPGVQLFLNGVRRNNRKAVRKSLTQTPFFEMVPGVGMVEHW
jgi:hypothetical protein